MFFHYRDQFPQLNDYWEKYLPFQEKIQAPARTILLEEGKVSQYYFYIEQDSLRAYFNHHGDAKTAQFFFEHEGLASIDSFVNNVPSLFTIETMEPSVIYRLPRLYVLEPVRELSSQPDFAQMMLQVSARRQSHYMSEFVSAIRDSPEERYQKLLTEKPHVILRVPQHYIASYLGVSTVHLSRIKNKLANGNSHF